MTFITRLFCFYFTKQINKSKQASLRFRHTYTSFLKRKDPIPQIWRRACRSGCVCVGVACQLNCLNQFEAMLVKSICTCTFIRGSVTGSHWFSSCLKIPSLHHASAMRRNTLGQVAQQQFMTHNGHLRMRTHHTRIFREGKVASTQPAKHLLYFFAILLHSHIRGLQAKYDSISDAVWWNLHMTVQSLALGSKR